MVDYCFVFCYLVYLQFPNFLKAWDAFVGNDLGFVDFVVHYVDVPKQEHNSFFCKEDDGIYVMKFLDSWDPMVNMKGIFTSSLIAYIRVQIVYRLLFSKHNSLEEMKQHVKDLDTFVSGSFFLLSFLLMIFLFCFFFLCCFVYYYN